MIPLKIFSDMLDNYIKFQTTQREYLDKLFEMESDAVVEYRGTKMPIEEAIQKHRKLMYQIRLMETKIKPEVEFIYSSDDTGIYLKPYSANLYIEPLWDMFDHILLSSATFFDVETLMVDLGLDKYSWKLIDVQSDFDPSKSPIIKEGNLYLNIKNFEYTIDKVVETIDNILSKHPDERGLIHCFSSRYREAIMKKSKQKNRLITHDSFNRDKVLNEFTSEIESNKVLVSVNMAEGVDLKDDLARFQIIVKAPFLPLNDPWIAIHKERSETWYRTQTIIQIMQMAGRVVRSKEDYGTTYIIDNNAWKILEANKKYLPLWFTERMNAGEEEKMNMVRKELSEFLYF